MHELMTHALNKEAYATFRLSLPSRNSEVYYSTHNNNLLKKMKVNLRTLVPLSTYFVINYNSSENDISKQLPYNTG